jgi:general stress protein CsbA
MSLIDGNKTKIITVATVVIGALYSQGYIDEKLFSTIDVIVSALIGFTLRDAIKKK